MKKDNEKIEKLKKDKNSPFYSMTLHEKDYIYLQTRWERYLKNRQRLEELKLLPLDKFDISEYNLVCITISNCKNLIIDFLRTYMDYKNVVYMKEIFDKYEK